MDGSRAAVCLIPLLAGCAEKQKAKTLPDPMPAGVECRLGSLRVDVPEGFSCFPTKAKVPGIGLLIDSPYPSGLAIAKPAPIESSHPKTPGAWLALVDREARSRVAKYRSMSKPVQVAERHAVAYFVEGVPKARPDSIKREGFMVSGSRYTRFVEYLPLTKRERPNVQKQFQKALDSIRLGD